MLRYSIDLNKFETTDFKTDWFSILWLQHPIIGCCALSMMSYCYIGSDSFRRWALKNSADELMQSHHVRHRRYYITEIRFVISRVCIVIVETYIAYITMA